MICEPPRKLSGRGEVVCFDVRNIEGPGTISLLGSAQQRSGDKPERVDRMPAAVGIGERKGYTDHTDRGRHHAFNDCMQLTRDLGRLKVRSSRSSVRRCAAILVEPEGPSGEVERRRCGAGALPHSAA